MYDNIPEEVSGLFLDWIQRNKCQRQLAFEIRLEDILTAFPGDFLSLSKTPEETNEPLLETIRDN